MLHDDSSILGEIYQLNLTYLEMLRRSLAQNFEAAVEAFGLSDEVARELANIAPERMEKFARTSQLLLRFKFNEVQFLRVLGEKINPVFAQQVKGKETVSA